MKPRKRSRKPVFQSIAVLLAATALSFGQSRTLPPKDEKGRDAKFAAFFTQLRDAVRKKDSNALVRAINPNIKNSFGGNDGASEFLRTWEPEKPDSKLWPVLDRIFALGGAWQTPTLYCAPHLFVKFPEDLDSFEHLVVTGTAVRLRAAASPTAAVRKSLSHAIVRQLKSGLDWTQVRTLDGATGFVSTAFLYSPVGYRACFGKSESGSWQMDLLVAGD